MELDVHTALEVVVGIALMLGGFVLKAIWTSLASVQERMRKIEVLVAGDYVTREEVDRKFDKILAEIKSITSRLGNRRDSD